MMPDGRPLLYVGTHVLRFAADLERSMVSFNQLERRRSDFSPRRWILDSGAFTRISTGRGHIPTKDYAQAVRRWSECGTLEAAVVQDYMCEPFVLEKTGGTVKQHQAQTTVNYLALRWYIPDEPYILPVLQGFTPDDYARHTEHLSEELAPGAWVGVGSVCKRQGDPSAISAVLSAILRVRPDLRLHGFGVKSTALASLDVRARLYSVDSMAWSYAGRRETPQRQNDFDYCREWIEKVEGIEAEPSQMAMGI